MDEAIKRRLDKVRRQNISKNAYWQKPFYAPFIENKPPQYR
jgi:hypothetical protein